MKLAHGRRLALDGHLVFIGASIPDRKRWDGSFDAYKITDAVVAIARSVLANGGRIVTGGHPTIAPLLLYVAAEQRTRSKDTVTIFQSEVFRDVLPAATQQFEADDVGRVIYTKLVDDEHPSPSRAPQSLRKMRTEMLTNEAPSAAVFIGGMLGIDAELELFQKIHPGAPWYALHSPGGRAAEHEANWPPKLRRLLTKGDVYPTIARAIIADLAEHVARPGPESTARQTPTTRPGTERNG